MLNKLIIDSMNIGANTTVLNKFISYLKIHQISLMAVFLFVCMFLSSCNKNEIDPTPKENHQTVFLYMPWSTNLTSYFRQNIADFETAIKKDALLRNERLIVFFATSSNEATLFEIEYKNGDCVRNTLKSYTTTAFTTAEGIASLIDEVKQFAPAPKYAMIVSSHAMGWLPVSGTKAKYALQKDYWEYEGVPLTRFFGGLSSEYQIDIPVFAEGIALSGTKMEYVMFDDCYMSTIEVAYDLKDVTDYLIASPTEVMAYGFPYADIGKYLFGNVDYYGISKGFLSFYEQYSAMPCGTIGVTVCSEVENMATIMKEINSRYQFDVSKVNRVQRLDGYTPIIFFDFADYVAKLCPDNVLLDRFYTQLERTVPSMYSMHTKTYYSMSRGQVNIDTYSGVTISDPSQNAKAKTKTETAWYRATH